MFRVIIDGLVVECETTAELAEVVRQFGGGDAGAGSNSSRSAGAESLGGTSRWTEKRIKDFFGLIQDRQKRLVDALLENPDGRTDAQLCQLLGYDDIRALAGVLSGVYKNAKKVGADPNDIYRRQPVTIGDKKQQEYIVTDSFRMAARRYAS